MPQPSFNAVLHAMWLTDGDTAAASRLLRIKEADLGEYLRDGVAAQACYCDRPADWCPEHSLSTPAGAAGENAFKVEHQTFEGTTYLKGSVRRDGDSAWLTIACLVHTDGAATWTPVQMPTADTPAPFSRVVACLNALYVRSTELMRTQAVVVHEPVLEFINETEVSA